MKTRLLILSFLVGVLAFGQDGNLTVEKQDHLYKVTLLHDNGKVAQTGYVNENKKLQGMWISYNTEGQKQTVGNYLDGKKVGNWFFFKNDNSEALTQVSFGNDHQIASVQELQSRSQLADLDLED